MGKLFRDLWKHKAAVLLIILLLIGQAYCDLSLPSYTSDIVDVGIQQGGIEMPFRSGCGKKHSIISCCF